MTKSDAPESGGAGGPSGNERTPSGNAPAWVDDVLNASRAGTPAPAPTRPPVTPDLTPPAPAPTAAPFTPDPADELRLPDDLPIPQGSRFDPDDWVARATGGQVKDPAVPTPQRASAPQGHVPQPVADVPDPWAPRTDAWGEAVPTPPLTTQPLDRYGHPDTPVALGDVGQKRLVAGLLAIFLGAFGVHKFYLGMTTPGLTLLGLHIGTWVVALVLGTLLFIVGLALTIPLAMLVSSALGVFGLVEGLILLTKSDAEFQREYLIGKKPWL